jgi:hypothetical protein
MEGMAHNGSSTDGGAAPYSWWRLRGSQWPKRSGRSGARITMWVTAKWRVDHDGVYWLASPGRRMVMHAGSGGVTSLTSVDDGSESQGFSDFKIGRGGSPRGPCSTPMLQFWWMVIDWRGIPISQEQWDPSKSVGDSRKVAICRPREICMVEGHTRTEHGKRVACWLSFAL